MVAVADLHGNLDRVEFPTGDVLVIAGDILDLNWSATSFEQAARDQETELGTLDDRVGKLGFKHILMVGGNHDFALERRPKLTKFKNIKLLQDEGVTTNGVKFWGSPWVPSIQMAFGCSWNHARHQWDKIPAGLDVLITHVPPFGILDRPGRTADPSGDTYLWKVVQERLPKIHIFGHVHTRYGRIQIGETLFVNASVVNGKRQLQNNPIALEI